MKAAASALVSSVGQGGIKQLLEETGAELVERGILAKHAKSRSRGKPEVHLSDARQETSNNPGATTLQVLPPTPAAVPTPAAKPPQPDINALLDSWSLKQPQTRAAEGDGQPAETAAAGPAVAGAETT